MRHCDHQISTTTRVVDDNSGGSRNLAITVTVQLTSIRLVVRKYVDDIHCSRHRMLSVR